MTLIMDVTLQNDDLYVEIPFNPKITLTVHIVRSWPVHE